MKDIIVQPISHDKLELLIRCDVPEAHWVLDQRIRGSDELYAGKTPFEPTLRKNISETSKTVVEVVGLQKRRVTHSQATTPNILTGINDKLFSGKLCVELLHDIDATIPRRLVEDGGTLFEEKRTSVNRINLSGLNG